jgi:ABC-type nitrate/sulfonate/bicarbonate transport system substrate-binding protein
MMQFHFIPSIIAHERLAFLGYSVTPTFYAQSEMAVAALARGDADIGFGASRTYWVAASKGAPVFAVMEQLADVWFIMARKDISRCRDLAGRKLAVHSEGGVAKALCEAYIERNCPGTRPQTVLISSSENRAAAMLAGEIDAAALLLADVIRVENRAPGTFAVLENFARDMPGIKTELIYVNRKFAGANARVVHDYIRTLLQAHRMVADNPKLLADKAASILKTEPELVSQMVKRHIEENAWDGNGGLTEGAVQDTLNFLTASGKLSHGLTSSQAADLSYLNRVLDEIGRK